MINNKVLGGIAKWWKKKSSYTPYWLVFAGSIQIGSRIVDKRNKNEKKNAIIGFDQAYAAAVAAYTAPILRLMLEFQF